MLSLILLVVSELPCTLLGVLVMASSSSNFNDVLVRSGANVGVVRAISLLAGVLMILAHDLGSLGDCCCSEY